MTEARIFKHQSSLARKMAVPGGKLIDSALRSAESALEAHRDAAMGTLDETLSSLEACFEARDRDQIYVRAAAMLDMAGFFDTGPLHPAVFSLCEISDPSGRHVWDWPSVQVHLRALRFILGDGCRTTESSRILLDGLASIRSRASRDSDEVQAERSEHAGQD